MNARKYDNFNDRLTTQTKAKQALQERFKARPGLDDPAVREKLEQQKAIAEARDARIAERKAAREAEAARLAAEAEAEAARLAAEAEAEAARLAAEAEA